MKPVIYVLLIVVGLGQIGLSLTMMRFVDRAMSQASVKPEEEIGRGTARGAALAPPAIGAEEATRMMVVGAAVAVLGAATSMAGTLLTAVHLLERRGTRSRLGTDIRPG
ncbi:MAG: hypothetical protein SFZ24_03865 [Planctomycetota bacterium]|nr:hypothetical protein [Planctomycetota bacterium]